MYKKSHDAASFILYSFLQELRPFSSSISYYLRSSNFNKE